MKTGQLFLKRLHKMGDNKIIKKMKSIIQLGSLLVSVAP